MPYDPFDSDYTISLDETILSLSEAAAAVPTQNGKRPSVSTIWRWCRKGLHGVRLEYLRCGRRIITSREALDRFFRALAECDREEPNLSSSSQGRRGEVDNAHRELEQDGL